ncbi:hypothetical protein EJ05DRAFT_476922 [Pseudovirgaria hyperparasitica]|uniref:TECPR1-like DysF domain-containing protein n=1 Tax=Pseudovirgaria hyperparasitica TaxID=470096 RepID=A0A6A6W9E5_9PEZI|nr:uncharacterized protein EJ05DRAFT_476922 [Pseudovirgaria hyperparasitica]KAF2757711.1 hypothetical protein EJ05DRAFT_476922 [Pseudovirgaria hyperparasitica]
MDDDTTGVFANRDEPIPVVITNPPEPTASNQTLKPYPQEKARSRSPAERLRTKLQDKLEEQLADQGADATADQPEKSTRKSIQDRLFNKIFEQFIPEDPGFEDEDEANGPKVKDRRSRKYVARPNFSLPVMSNNFRRFNARIGVVFVFQNRAIRLFSWADPSHTLSFLAIYTLICLNPHLLPVLPLAGTLFFIMVPAFLTRHPPAAPNSSSSSSFDPSTTDLYPYLGPPTAPARHVKPAPDFSKDFFRNMRDLQNSMEDFSRAHDNAIALIAPLTNFSNEALSSSVFLLVFAAACALFVASGLVPWRAGALLLGWAATCAGHPAAQQVLLSRRTERVLRNGERAARKRFNVFAAADNILAEAPEMREVEVFELQRREEAALYGDERAATAYEPYMFSPAPYTPLSPARISGERPRGTRFFEDVRAPQGWKWADKKWTLDLLSTEWVGERMITGVEVEVEGERWVSDILYDEGVSLLAEEDGMMSADAGVSLAKKGAKGGKVKIGVRKTWEEGNGTGRKGEWRRRRWVRMVQRKVYGPDSKD